MKIVIGLLAAAILGTGGFAFAAGVDDTQPARTVSLPGTTTGTTTAATTAATTTDDIVIGNAPAATTTNGDDISGLDISGPCDEAEHANDPRCTGAAPTTATTTTPAPAPATTTTTTTTRAPARATTTTTTTTRATARTDGHDSDDD